MADAAVARTRPTVWSLVAAGLFVLVGALLISSTYGTALPAWLRWGAVLVWAVLTGVVVLIDAKLDPTTDSRPVDIWTIAHGFAGIVFGIWFVPIWLIVTLTVLWEVFEAVTSGIGDEEVIINRVVDVGIAITLWAAVILVTMLVQQGTSFPLFPPFHAPFAA
jgi:hypothetical protein